MSTDKRFEIRSIGSIRRENDKIFLQIDEKIRPALKELDKFTHVMVFWWADQHDNEESRTTLQTRPPYAEEYLCGVFATRAEYRPNPIEMTVCKIVSIDETKGIVTVGNIDAFDGTNIIDLKAYFPVCDRVRDAKLPEWLEGWPEWMPDNGIGMEY